jgi:hypothetical protein
MKIISTSELRPASAMPVALGLRATTILRKLGFAAGV